MTALSASQQKKHKHTMLLQAVRLAILFKEKIMAFKPANEWCKEELGMDNSCSHEEWCQFIDYVGCQFLHKHGEDLRYCSHKENQDPCEDNCNATSCPMAKLMLEGKAQPDAFDPMNQYDNEEF